MELTKENQSCNGEHCPVTVFVNLVGGKWKTIILYSLMHGSKRFGEIDTHIDSISRKVLTDQLKELERDGLIKRQAFKEIPPRVEYELTDLGRSLNSVFAAIANWTTDYQQLISKLGKEEGMELKK